MPMPKASVDEDDFSPTGEHQVGPPRESWVVETIAISNRVQSASKLQLRLGILGANFCHMCAALGRGHEIRHGLILLARLLSGPRERHARTSVAATRCEVPKHGQPAATRPISQTGGHSSFFPLRRPTKVRQHSQPASTAELQSGADPSRWFLCP